MLYSLSEPLVFIPDSPAGVINTHLSGYLTLQPYSRGGVSHGQSPWLWWLSQMRSVFTPSAYLQRRIGSSCVEQPELGVGRGSSEYVVLGVRSWLRQGLWASCRHLHLIPWISVKMKVKFQYLATSWEELTHWKRLWCWEGLGAGGEGDDRGWEGWMASSTRWTWVWVNAGSWWRIGRPGVLRFMGSQRVGHDRVPELNWTELRGRQKRGMKRTKRREWAINIKGK